MVNELLNEFLSSLSREEKKELRQFMKKQYARNDNLEYRILDLWLKGKSNREIQETLLPVETARLAEGQQSSRKFQKYTSYLKRKLETYLVLQFLEQHPQEKSLILLQVLSQKGWHGSFKKEWKKGKTIQEQATEPSHHREYEHLRLGYNHFHRIADQEGEDLLPTIFDKLDQYWASEKYQHLLGFLHKRRNQNGLPYEFPTDLDLLFTLTAPETALGKLPEIQMMRQICRAQMGIEATDYEALARQLRKVRPRLSQNASQSLFTGILHRFMLEFNQDRSEENARRLYLWYVWGFRQDLILRYGQLLPGHYKNFLGAALSLKRYPQMERWLKELTPLLPASRREELHRLLYAAFLFEKGELKEVLELRLFPFHFPSDEISVRFYQIKAAVMLNERKNIPHDLAAIHARLKRGNNLGEHQIVVHAQRLALMRKFLQAKSPSQKEEMKKALQHQAPNPDTQWMLEHLWAV